MTTRKKNDFDMVSLYPQKFKAAKSLLLNSLMEYFYFHQYDESRYYWRSLDRHTEYDYDGESYYCYSGSWN